MKRLIYVMSQLFMVDDANPLKMLSKEISEFSSHLVTGKKRICIFYVPDSKQKEKLLRSYKVNAA